tara:strand:+ start:1463 stop:1720 length:258 start_codon:yes stop_codon:yes gene_type:complete
VEEEEAARAYRKRKYEADEAEFPSESEPVQKRQHIKSKKNKTEKPTNLDRRRINQSIARRHKPKPLPTLKPWLSYIGPRASSLNN